MFGFEKLEVWQEAMTLTVEVHNLTKLFPKSEQFSLTNQVQRAISSVAANIAEGNSRKTGKDKAHFTTISYCSLMETMNHLILASRLNYIDEPTLEEFREKIKKVGTMLNALYNYQNSLTP